MARIKARPRVAQPDLDRRAYTPEAQAMSSAINEYQLRSNQASDDENNHDTDKPNLPKMATITGSEQPITEKRSAAEELVNIGHRLALTNLTCPQCLSKFPDMRIKVSQIYLFVFFDLQPLEINYRRSYLIAFTEPS
jgi:hypothetical protein